MALEIEFDDGYGVLHPAAYARIQKVIIENPPGRDKNVATEICVYHSQAAYEAGKTHLHGPQGLQVIKPADVQPPTPEPKEGEEAKPVRPIYECAVDPDKVTVAEVYAWLKTQEAYSGGKDV
jgi:hypothetical protein